MMNFVTKQITESFSIFCVRCGSDKVKIEFHAGDIPYSDEKCEMDVFENHIREIGAVTVCEWFGYGPDSEFTKETIRVLIERSNHKVNPAGAASPVSEANECSTMC